MKKRIGALVGVILIGVFVFGFIRTQFLWVASDSMEPTLRKGEIIRIDRSAYTNSNPVKDEVVVFSLPVAPDLLMIARVTGVPGEVVTISEIGETVILRPDEYFLVGDNKSVSVADSRNLGPIPKDQIHGRINLN